MNPRDYLPSRCSFGFHRWSCLGFLDRMEYELGIATWRCVGCGKKTIFPFGLGTIVNREPELGSSKD